MTRDECAALLDGRQVGMELTPAEEALAAQAGLVVVFGASDELLELRGAIHDETGAWAGTHVFLTRDGIFDEAQCPDKCRYFLAARRLATQHGTLLSAHWQNTTPCWTYTISIPHSTFMILDNGLPYCQGIVFTLADVERRADTRRRASMTPGLSLPIPVRVAPVRTMLRCGACSITISRTQRPQGEEQAGLDDAAQDGNAALGVCVALALSLMLRAGMVGLAW